MNLVPGVVEKFLGERQDGTADLGWSGWVLLAQFHGISAAFTQRRHRYGVDDSSLDETALPLAARELGLKAKIVAQPACRLAHVSRPAFASSADGDPFIVAAVLPAGVLIHDLRLQRPVQLGDDELQTCHAGRLLQLASQASVLGERARLDRLFRHLLALPLAYFESRRVGDTVARVRELENIRNFLTGQALTSVLDLVFTAVVLAVMFFYSGGLSLIAVLSLPVCAPISAGITPSLRRRLDEEFARGAGNPSFLVEAVSGIGTIRATAVDPCIARICAGQLAGGVESVSHNAAQDEPPGLVFPGARAPARRQPAGRWRAGESDPVRFGRRGNRSPQAAGGRLPVLFVTAAGAGSDVRVPAASKIRENKWFDLDMTSGRGSPAAENPQEENKFLPGAASERRFFRWPHGLVFGRV